MQHRHIPLVAVATAVLLMSIPAHAAQRCHGTRITRQCASTNYESLCPINDFQCRFFKQSTNQYVCYTFQVPCAYDERGIEGRLGLLAYPLLKVESRPLTPPY